MSHKRRVVITGLGMISPLATGVEKSWQKIINGQSGIGKIDLFDTSNVSCSIAGQVKFGNNEGEFNPDNFIDPKEQRKMDRFIHFAIGAAEEAMLIS